MSGFQKSYAILSEILRKGAFVNLALQDVTEEERAFVTKTVYGTLETYFENKYIIAQLTAAPPKPQIEVILLQGIYALRHLSVPAYAVVNENVNLTEEIGKRQVKGFVNAILNKVSRGEYKLPKENEPAYLEVKYNLPAWLIGMVKAEYPAEYDCILSAEGRAEEHVRLSGKMNPKKFEQEAGVFEKTPLGYYVKNTAYIKDLFKKGLLTYQSYTSVFAAEAFGNVFGKTVLDVCAAPGGKSVLLAEKGAAVTACDLYPHRVRLIEDYAGRMGVSVRTQAADALVFCKDWEKRFDCVLVDAPCSGLGVLSKRRDIIFNRSPEDIGRLAALQRKILKNAAQYVKPGGLLVYSTCTILHKENRGVTGAFLAENKEFSVVPVVLHGESKQDLQFLPDNKGTDGFYICKMRRDRE